jgi:hypothetical protein
LGTDKIHDKHANCGFKVRYDICARSYEQLRADRDELAAEVGRLNRIIDEMHETRMEFIRGMQLQIDALATELAKRESLRVSTYLLEKERL